MAKTEVSERLNFKAVIVSVEVGKLRFIIGEDLPQARFSAEPEHRAPRNVLGFIPNVNAVGSSGE